MASADIQETDNEVDEHTKPPFLRRVRIRGYKSIAFCDVALEPLTVLVGRNGAGKSNFLDALAFLRDALIYNPSVAIKGHGGINAIRHRSTEVDCVEIELETGFKFGSDYVARYGLSLAPDGSGLPSSITEWLQIRDATTNVESSFSSVGGTATWSGGPFDGRSVHVPPNHLLLNIIGVSPCDELSDRLRWVGIYNLQPDRMRQPQIPDSESLLDRDGANLASVIEMLKVDDPEILQRIQEYVSLIAPEVLGFSRVGYGEYESIRFSIRGATQGDKVELDAASMSDGTLRVIGALIAAFQRFPHYGHPSVVGIEDPETALHPAAVHVLVDALREATQHTQILLTTHSPDLLDDRYLDPKQVLVVRNRNGQTVIAPVSPAGKEIVQKELYTLADLQRMDHLDPDEENLAEQSKVANGRQE